MKLSSVLTDQQIMELARPLVRIIQEHFEKEESNHASNTDDQWETRIRN